MNGDDRLTREKHPAPIRARLMRTFNVVPKLILRSPLHAIMSKKLILLTFTGRRTGRSYTTPVSYLVEQGGTLLVAGGAPWWRNVRQGMPVRVRLRGRDRLAQPEVVGERDELAGLLRVILPANPILGRFMGLRARCRGRRRSAADRGSDKTWLDGGPAPSRPAEAAMKTPSRRRPAFAGGVGILAAGETLAFLLFAVLHLGLRVPLGFAVLAQPISGTRPSSRGAVWLGLHGEHLRRFHPTRPSLADCSRHPRGCTGRRPSWHGGASQWTRPAHRTKRRLSPSNAAGPSRRHCHSLSTTHKSLCVCQELKTGNRSSDFILWKPLDLTVLSLGESWLLASRLGPQRRACYAGSRSARAVGAVCREQGRCGGGVASW